MEMMKYPRDKDNYVPLVTIAKSQAVSLYKAKAKLRNPATGHDEEVLVGIKIINRYKTGHVYDLLNEIRDAETCDQENIAKVHCSFANGKDKLWIVMSPLSGSSLRSVIRSSFPNGLPKRMAVFILKETLKALNCMHEKNKLHRRIGADCIFLDEYSSTVKLAFHSLKYEIHDTEFEDSDWMMAPEFLKNSKQGHDKATDVWMFGVLALELFYGHPVHGYKEYELSVEGIDNGFGLPRKKNPAKGFGSSSSGFLSCFSPKEKRISKPLGEFLAACFCEEPSERATTSQLMGLEFFNNCKVESSSNLKKVFKN